MLTDFTALNTCTRKGKKKASNNLRSHCKILGKRERERKKKRP